jgi:hypothetical protein
MKTYVITFSREFPSTHKRSGEETGFVEKILSGNKIHTIRDSYYFWEDRFKKIYKGDACLSLRYWSGKPYKSKQVEFLKLTKDDGIGMQPIVIDDNKDFLFVKPLSPNEKIMKGHFSNINKPDPYLLNEIAKNDGLDVDDFEDWFKGKQMIGAIIHFTKFRY